MADSWDFPRRGATSKGTRPKGTKEGEDRLICVHELFSNGSRICLGGPALVSLKNV